ncbi:ECF family sigma factor [Bordetella ansorpii]|uniref:ECF family sigma factor n=1 Tax=Bordetella ansorpii TaxID=288768 RepID=A0A157S903_9BORD|nr:sigma-70 family RNA polymerase sigma factor [Bordetella ansorpii]SAI66887.1 ECF family sigma factor [Bordetella ansorpii]
MSTYTLAELRHFLTDRYDALKRRLAYQLGSEERAGDALHDTWVRLNGRDDMPPVDNPQAFVLRMAVNSAVDRWRKDTRLVSASEIDDLLQLDDAELGPRHSLEAQFELQQLLRVLDELPERRRQIFLAIRIDGVTRKELSKQYGISQRAIEAELRRAHDYCAQRLDRGGV